MKTSPKKPAPLSIDAAARRLQADRRTLTAALQRSAEIDYILPADSEGVRGTPRWYLHDACEALELWRIRRAPADNRPWCERRAADFEIALAMDCPRCGGRHFEMPILPMPGKQDTPEIVAWYERHGFAMHYPEAGRPHAFC